MKQGIPYAAVAMTTDFDCWKEEEKPVTWEDILKIFGQECGKVTNVLLEATPRNKITIAKR